MDGSQSSESENMRAGFYRHDIGTGGCCKVGNSDEEESSNRSEHAAAALALENLLATDSYIVILTDSKCSWTQSSHGLARVTIQYPQIPKRRHLSRYH